MRVAAETVELKELSERARASAGQPLAIVCERQLDAKEFTCDADNLVQELFVCCVDRDLYGVMTTSIMDIPVSDVETGPPTEVLRGRAREPASVLIVRQQQRSRLTEFG